MSLTIISIFVAHLIKMSSPLQSQVRLL
jgi:hypothetical protein